MFKTLIYEIKNNLCLVNFVSLHKPQIISSIERCDISISFALLLACANVWHRFEAMSGEDLRVVSIRSIVHYAKKRVKVRLFVAVLNTGQLVVDTCAIIASGIHRKEHNNIVRPWIFNNQLPNFLSLDCTYLYSSVVKMMIPLGDWDSRVRILASFLAPMSPFDED